MVARPVPYELSVMGDAGVPPDVNTNPPENIWPPSNNMLSPGENVTLFTLVVVFHACDVLVPVLLSLPEGLT
jgi:hypothetical protein